jgi:hypothetical protein
MFTLTERMPDYKALIVRCIHSCITSDQLLVCDDFIRLFEDRFKHAVPPNEFKKHSAELMKNYEQKQVTLL